MVLKKVLMGLPTARVFRRELKYLYSRRDAVDNLIRSLEDYGRYLPKPQSYRKRKTA